MKKIVRITSNKTLLPNEKRFREAIPDVGDINIDFIYYPDLYYKNGFRKIENNEKIDEYDIYRIGGKKGISMLKGLIYNYGYLEKKTIIDSRRMHMLNNDKFSQLLYLEKSGYRTPESMFFIVESEDKINDYINLIKKEFAFPLIMKHVDVDRGEGVFLIKTEQEILELLRNSIDKGILCQNFIENKGDYRILVIGDRVIGAIKRYNPNDFKNNISKGGEGTAIELPEHIKDSCVKMANGFGCQIAGIDLFVDGDNFTVIEINALPQFDGFEKATGLSYPKEVLKYFLTL